jgi:hypothetical protein
MRCKLNFRLLDFLIVSVMTSTFMFAYSRVPGLDSRPNQPVHGLGGPLPYWRYDTRTQLPPKLIEPLSVLVTHIVINAIFWCVVSILLFKFAKFIFKKMFQKSRAS